MSKTLDSIMSKTLSSMISKTLSITLSKTLRLCYALHYEVSQDYNAQAELACHLNGRLGEIEGSLSASCIGITCVIIALLIFVY